MLDRLLLLVLQLVDPSSALLGWRETEPVNPLIRQTFHSLFINATCVHLFGDGSKSSNKTIQALCWEMNTALIVEGTSWPEELCEGAALALRSPQPRQAVAVPQSVRGSHPRERLLVFRRKVLILYQRCSTDFLILLRQHGMGQFLFKDAEGLVVCLNLGLPIYLRLQPSRDLQQVHNLNENNFKMGSIIKDFKGITLDVATFNCNLFSSIGPLNIDGSPSWTDGVEARMVEELTQRLELKWQVHVPPGPNKWGQLVNGSWTSGIMQEVQRGWADLAFCGLWFEEEALKGGLEITLPLGQECLVFLVPRPQPQITGWTIIFKPYSLEVWLLLAASFCLTSFFLLLFSKVTSHWFHNHKRYISFERCVFEIVSIFFSSGIQQNISGALRQFAFGVTVFSFLLNTCYSSGLFAQLAMPAYTEKLDKLEDLLANNYYWTTTYSPDSTLMFDLQSPVEAAWARRYAGAETWSEVMALYRKNPKMVLLGQKIESGIYIDEEYESSEFIAENFEASSVCHRSKMYGFVFRGGTQYMEAFNFFIALFQSAGLLSKHIIDSLFELGLREPHVRRLLEFEKTHLSEFSSLSMSNLVGVFNVHMLGLLLALFVFLAELIVFRLSCG